VYSLPQKSIYRAITKQRMSLLAFMSQYFVLLFMSYQPKGTKFYSAEEVSSYRLLAKFVVLAWNT
jgi:hypothetical protein